MNLLRALAMVSSLTLVSRILGYLRDFIIARAFGASLATDAFFVAFRIPNLMRRLFAEGSFSQAFVPILAEYQKQKKIHEVQAFINAVAGSLASILLVVVFAGIIFSPFLIHVFAPGFSANSDRFDLAVSMLRITFPYLLLISMTAFSGVFLNTYRSFCLPAFVSILLYILIYSDVF